MFIKMLTWETGKSAAHIGTRRRNAAITLLGIIPTRNITVTKAAIPDPMGCIRQTSIPLQSSNRPFATPIATESWFWNRYGRASIL